MKEHVFISAIEACDKVRSTFSKNPLGITEERDQYEWIYWGDDDGKRRIMPSMNSYFFRPYLFRGQTKIYSPCFPKLYRNFKINSNTNTLSKDDEVYFLLWKVKLNEFIAILKQHPFSKYADKIGLHLNYIALAQHYGLPTEMLDLTQDLDVAAFFATNWQNSSGNWMQESDGIGVIYKFNYLSVLEKEANTEEIRKYFQKIEMIGFQLFPKPGEQKAWTIKLPLGLNFEDLPVERFVFKHSNEISMKFFKQFNSAKSLFPFDLMEKYVKMIINSNQVSLNTVKTVFIENGCPKHLLDYAIKKFGKKFKNRFNVAISKKDSIKLSKNDISYLTIEFEQKRDLFLSKVGVRPVKNGKIDSKTKEIPPETYN